MVEGAPHCALLGGLAIGARVLLLWQYTRLMRNVSEDACTRCVAAMAGFLLYFIPSNTTEYQKLNTYGRIANLQTGFC